MSQLLPQLLQLPFQPFLIGLNVMSTTLKSVQQITTQTFDVLSATTAPSGTAPPPVATAPPAATPGVPTVAVRADAIDPGVFQGTTQPVKRDKEERTMSCDQNLSGDDIKVVQYSIITVESNVPDDKRLIGAPNQIKVVSDDMTGEEFSNWVIASNCGSLEPYDSRYLRVCYCVLCRYKKQDVDYDQEQIDALHQIRDAIIEKPKK